MLICSDPWCWFCGSSWWLVSLTLVGFSIDQGTKFCSKIQSAQNRFKSDKSVGLIVANPTQLVSSQTDVGSERYCNLFIKSNREKKWCWLYSPYRLTWQNPYDDVEKVTWKFFDWLAVGRISLWHVASYGQMAWCHVAQSWAATWHPFIGFGLLIKILCSRPDSNRGPPPLAAI